VRRKRGREAHLRNEERERVYSSYFLGGELKKKEQIAPFFRWMLDRFPDIVDES
jgi:hypothetical protein